MNKRPSEESPCPSDKRNKVTEGLYVVSCLHSYGDPCSPDVIGVYTSKQAALENARAVFEAKRAGDDNLDGFEDNSKDLERFEGKGRAFFEYIVDDNLLAVAINHIPDIDTVFKDDVPLLRDGGFSESFSTRGKSSKAIDSGTQKVYVIMGGGGSDGWGGEDDPFLLGLFSSKEHAIDAAKEEVEDVDQDELVDNTGTIGERGFLIGPTNELEDGGYSNSFAINTFVLDAPFAKDKDQKRYEMEIAGGCGCSGIYMQPVPVYEEIERPSKPNTPPEVKKESKENMPSVRPSKPNKAPEVKKESKQNMLSVTSACMLCSEVKARSEFSKTQWKKGNGGNGRKCKACVQGN